MHYRATHGLREFLEFYYIWNYVCHCREQLCFSNTVVVAEDIRLLIKKKTKYSEQCRWVLPQIPDAVWFRGRCSLTLRASESVEGFSCLVWLAGGVSACRRALGPDSGGEALTSSGAVAREGLPGDRRVRNCAWRDREPGESPRLACLLLHVSLMEYEKVAGK